MSSFIDLTGNKYGKLTVIKRVENQYTISGHLKVMWLCKCECGNEKIISSSSLRNGIKSCGCLGGVLKDLTGKRYGHLQVLRRVGTDNNECATWECKCDCGEICVFPYNKIAYNKNPSCGCTDLQNKMLGRKFGKLTVIKRVGSDNSGKATWLCKCDCGNESIVTGDRLRSGMTKSCGCLLIHNRLKQDGLSKNRLYKIWYGMKSRCYNKKDSSYKNYGGKGIVVCDEWLGKDGYKNFYKWSMENGYTDDLTIDRMDSDKNYEPCNCRWATMQEQANNKKENLRFIIDGKEDTLANWCRIYSVPYYVVYDRIKYRNYDIVEALTKPIRRSQK